MCLLSSNTSPRAESLPQLAHEHGALLIAVIPEPVASGLLAPPGQFEVDIVVGEAQSFGNPLNYGGPYVGFFAIKSDPKRKVIRKMPGRLAGETRDAEGRRVFVLTLSTREQHIKRERATSKICFTLQPAAGEHGELTGMMTIQTYLESQGNLHKLDITKRLMDYGFHPPTVYFPLIVVAGALMIEPTETESKETLDEFIAAMKEIAREAREEPQLLKTAPHRAKVRRLDETTAARKPKLRYK